MANSFSLKKGIRMIYDMAECKGERFDGRTDFGVGFTDHRGISRYIPYIANRELAEKLEKIAEELAKCRKTDVRPSQHTLHFLALCPSWFKLKFIQWGLVEAELLPLQPCSAAYVKEWGYEMLKGGVAFSDVEVMVAQAMRLLSMVKFRFLDDISWDCNAALLDSLIPLETKNLVSAQEISSFEKFIRWLFEDGPFGLPAT